VQAVGVGPIGCTLQQIRSQKEHRITCFVSIRAPLPTLVFHSRDDELIDARHTRALVDAFPAFRVEWLAGVRHAAMPRAVLEQQREQAFEALGVAPIPRPR